jgi:hypothetical protein
VTKFGLTMRGGKRSLLVAAENVCAHPQRATALFVGHDNAGSVAHPPLRPECGRGKR